MSTLLSRNGLDWESSRLMLHDVGGTEVGQTELGVRTEGEFL